MPLIRRLLRNLIPPTLARRLIEWRTAKFQREMSGRTSDAIFTEIYRRGMWGGSASGNRFYSGRGSHIPEIVEPYIAAVGRFLESFASPPDVADLGCGDFAVGSRLRAKCRRYVACDIVPELIEHNRQAFADLDVDFRTLDLTTGELSGGDVAFVRQVMQHMSNAEISALIPKLRAKYEYIIVTEQVPCARFAPNTDKSPGADIRISVNSGVVLTAPPFSLAPVAEQVLCQVREGVTVIRTHLYKLK